MIENGRILFARTGEDFSEGICLNPKMANRHGFICGATGTGKTVTLKVLAESFSELGVPVFLADVKGDLSGMIMPGQDNENMQQRIKKYHLENTFKYQKYPASFFDIFGKNGMPLRTTVSEMGPQLMAQCLELNDTQTDVLTVVYKIADDQKLLLLDTKDLKAMLSYVSENASEYENEYGHIAKTTIATIIRAIVAVEAEGGDHFFGEPAIDINDFFTIGDDGRGMINILDSQTLINKPRLYAAFMLYLLSELFEVLPEVGDLDKPKLVFFFDEAHLLFKNASQALLDKITQVIKLIRSKGVGVYFVTQAPADIPNDVMAQLSNKIEHALRAYTPAEIKGLKAIADAFRENPEFDTKELLQQLGTGEAIVSLLGDDGIPGISQHAYILPPESLMLVDKYQEMIDRDSCYEFMQRRQKQEADALTAANEEQAAAAAREKEAGIKAKEEEKARKEAEKEAERQSKRVSKAAKSVLSTTAGSVGRQIGYTLGKSVGGKFGKTLGGNIGASLGRNILGTLFKG